MSDVKQSFAGAAGNYLHHTAGISNMQQTMQLCSES